ncbi:hypothetical protein BDAP_000452 [Binucleata daphniae]
MKNELYNIYLCRSTLLQMLQDRKYPQNTTTKECTFEMFTKLYPNASTDRNTLKMHVQKENEPVKMVHYFDEEKVGLKNLKIIIDNFERQGIFNIILVCKDSLSPASMKHLESLVGFNIEVFKEKELLFNITKHDLVPVHRILNEEEKKEMMTMRRIKEHQLPRILIGDPVAKYFGAKRGDVFEILRKSETAGMAVYYRIVV